jgi:alpha-galactosidase
MTETRIFGKTPAAGRGRRDLGAAQVEYSVEKIPAGYLVTGTVRGRPGRLEVVRLAAPPEFLLNNWQSWGPTQRVSRRDRFPELEAIHRDYSPYIFSPVPDLMLRRLVSDYFAAGPSRLAGFLASRIAHPYFVVEDDELVGVLDYFDLAADEPVPLEPLVLLEGAPVEALLGRYAELAGAENAVTINPWNPVGWCSWYHYFGRLEWADVLKNLDLARGDPRWPFEVFQVDDGYQADIGDWLEGKPGYPALAEMAGAIRSRGFRAGIWTAPFSAAESSRLFRDHPDWMVAEAGRPKPCYRGWKKTVYALDTSRADVRVWLADVFASLNAAGFDYFKVDFLFAASIPGERSRPSTPVQAYREGLRAVRSAVGPSSFLLGCGAPLLPSAGLVDGMRIGEDTAPYWKTKPSAFQGPNAYFALKNALLRSFMHKTLWLNDPDCLLLRSSRIDLSETERACYALTSGALDNMILASDDLSLVDGAGRGLLEQALRLRGGRVVVRGLLGDDFYLVESRGGPAGPVDLAVNLSDERRLYKERAVPARGAVIVR